MSDYIIHNIGITVSPQLDLFGLVEEDKAVDKYPNYYLGKIIGDVGNELDLNRTSRLSHAWYFHRYNHRH